VSAARRGGSKTTAEEHRRPVREAGCRLGFSREEIAESNKLFALLVRRRAGRPSVAGAKGRAAVAGKGCAPSSGSAPGVRHPRRLERLLAFIEGIVARVKEGERIVVSYPGIPRFFMVPLSDLPLIERLDGPGPSGGRRKRRPSISMEELARRLAEWLDSKAKARSARRSRRGRSTTPKAER